MYIRIPHNLCRYSILRGNITNHPLLKHKFSHSDFLLKFNMEEREKSNITVQKLDKYYFSQWIPPTNRRSLYVMSIVRIIDMR